MMTNRQLEDSVKKDIETLTHRLLQLLKKQYNITNKNTGKYNIEINEANGGITSIKFKPEIKI